MNQSQTMKKFIDFNKDVILLIILTGTFDKNKIYLQNNHSRITLELNRIKLYFLIIKVLDENETKESSCS